jgi:hypothetical protein
MWNLSVKFDPVTGVRVAARIDAMVQALFGDNTPDGCPGDPIEKQRYLAARAVARLLLDEALSDHHANTDDTSNTDTSDDTANPAPRPSRPRTGRPEFVVVIDADAPGPGPVAEFSIPVEIPARVLATLAGDADIHAVVVRNGVVLHAPGELNLGHSTRLANRAQRRALRSLYRSCAIPGCNVAYDHCKLHHIIWWRNNGRTDLDNLTHSKSDLPKYSSAQRLDARSEAEATTSRCRNLRTSPMPHPQRGPQEPRPQERPDERRAA